MSDNQQGQATPPDVIIARLHALTLTAQLASARETIKGLLDIIHDDLDYKRQHDHREAIDAARKLTEKP